MSRAYAIPAQLCSNVRFSFIDAEAKLRAMSHISARLSSSLATAPGWLPWFACGLTMLFWASSFVVIRAGAEHFEPGPMALLRMSAAAAVMLAFAFVARIRLPRSWRTWCTVCLWGLLWFAVYTVVLNAAERDLDAATAAMLVNLAPLIVAVVSGLFFGEGLNVRLLCGIAVALGGIALITAATSTGRISIIGVVLAVVAALIYAGAVLAQKRILRVIDSNTMTVIGIMFAALACVPFAPELGRQVAEAPLGAVLVIVYLGVFPTAIAFVLWGYALTHTPAGVLSTSSLVVPALVVVMSWVVLGETPPPLAALGGLLCLVGAGFAIAPHVSASLAARRRGISSARPITDLHRSDPSRQSGDFTANSAAKRPSDHVYGCGL